MLEEHGRVGDTSAVPNPGWFGARTAAEVVREAAWLDCGSQVLGFRVKPNLSLALAIRAVPSGPK